jgi:hypothetical protein
VERKLRNAVIIDLHPLDTQHRLFRSGLNQRFLGADLIRTSWTTTAFPAVVQLA